MVEPSTSSSIIHAVFVLHMRLIIFHKVKDFLKVVVKGDVLLMKYGNERSCRSSVWCYCSVECSYNRLYKCLQRCD